LRGVGDQVGRAVRRRYLDLVGLDANQVGGQPGDRGRGSLPHLDGAGARFVPFCPAEWVDLADTADADLRPAGRLRLRRHLRRDGGHRHPAAAHPRGRDAQGRRVTRPDPLPHQHRAPRRHFRQPLLRGAGTVVNHKGLYDNFRVGYAELDPYEYAREAIPADDPGRGRTSRPTGTYYADPNKGAIVFTGSLFDKLTTRRSAPAVPRE
jgi:hypothetical protein